jgi:biopolymer transport protein ExbD
MAANLGTGNDRRSVNVDLNIVPFIDLMSCLTAFLLVTAVWVDIAQLDTKPIGRNGEVPPTKIPQLSILVDAEGIWVGESQFGAIQHIDGHDWGALDLTLTAHKTGPTFVDRGDVQLAAESRPGHEVLYQELITAMDIAHRAGFRDVGLTDPEGLETRPQL